MKNLILVSIIAWLLALHLGAQQAAAAETMAIWPEGSPELEGVKDEHVPHLYLYPGEKTDEKKPAVLILPAGGYKHHSASIGYVKWLNDLGIAAFVVKYRLPVHGYKHPAPLHDAQRSMRIIRHNAEAWGIDPDRIGILGGSSGGHLASTLATHYDSGNKDADDPIERMGCRPNFAIMLNAVVTMQGKFCHTPSRARLLPENPPQELVDALSNELQVTPDTPPTFLHHSGQDRLVPAENSLMFFMALRRNNVAFSELHFNAHGGHGYPPVDFTANAEAWLRRLGVIGDLHADENVKKSLTTPGRWGDDNT